MERNLITKAQAMKDWNNGEGITRQRIHQLIAEGRLTKPVDASGNVIRGCLYLDEVVSFKKLKRGRPRLIQNDPTYIDDDNRIPESGTLPTT